MNTTKRTTFYSLAVGAAGLLLMFASGCGDSGSDGACADDEINISGRGCRPTCNPDSPDCPQGQICQGVTGGGGACVQDGSQDPDMGTNDDTGTPSDAGQDTQNDTQTQEDTVEDTQSDTPTPSRALSCYEANQCLDFACAGQGSTCQQSQLSATDSTGQTNFTDFQNCIRNTCSEACSGTGDNCLSCLENNCSSSLNACTASTSPTSTETCGDLFQCYVGCINSVSEPVTTDKINQCIQNDCGFGRLPNTVNNRFSAYLSCFIENTGFGERSGPDAGIGTEPDSGMQVSTCSTQADANGNQNYQIDTTDERTAQNQCVYNECGMEIDNCFGCR